MKIVKNKKKTVQIKSNRKKQLLEHLYLVLDRIENKIEIIVS